MIYGDGEQTRDFTYVANVVDGVLRACDAPDVSSLIINVATGGRISLNRLFETMRRLIGATVQPSYVGGREGDVRDSQADISLARRVSSSWAAASGPIGTTQTRPSSAAMYESTACFPR